MFFKPESRPLCLTLWVRSDKKLLIVETIDGLTPDETNCFNLYLEMGRSLRATQHFFLLGLSKVPLHIQITDNLTHINTLEVNLLASHSFIYDNDKSLAFSGKKPPFSPSLYFFPVFSYDLLARCHYQVGYPSWSAQPMLLGCYVWYPGTAASLDVSSLVWYGYVWPSPEIKECDTNSVFLRLFDNSHFPNFTTFKLQFPRFFFQTICWFQKRTAYLHDPEISSHIIW